MIEARANGAMRSPKLAIASAANSRATNPISPAGDLSAVSVVNCNSVVFEIRLHRNTSSDFETSSRRMSDTLLAGSIASSRK